MVWHGPRDPRERGLDGLRVNAVEVEEMLGEAGPETAPPAGEDAGPCRIAGALEVNERKQVIREGADPVHLCGAATNL
jgi:hypothetical protein